MSFQTYSKTVGIAQFNTLAEALRQAEKDGTIWKISFSMVSSWPNPHFPETAAVLLGIVVEYEDKVVLERTTTNEWILKQ